MEDVNHTQPAYEFMAMLTHGHEFVSNPEENPVILSDFFDSAAEELFSNGLLRIAK